MREDDTIVEYICMVCLVLTPFVTCGMILWGVAIYFDLY
jgi:hypothetical protein